MTVMASGQRAYQLADGVTNEPVLEYRPGSPERALLRDALATLENEVAELPSIIDGKKVRTGKLESAECPHDHGRVLGHAHLVEAPEMNLAIEAAAQAGRDWRSWAWQDRAAIFRRAADLLAGPWRYRLNAATMLGQSKTVHQAEIDSATELIDFFRFNVAFLERIHAEQPLSQAGVHNSIDYRPLEGFVYAVTPFNFTAIAGNLPTAPALLGNGVVWKPSANAKLSAYLTLELLKEAGLPDGVINLVFGDPHGLSRIAIDHPDFAGLHFTGSTAVFDGLVKTIASGSHRNFPRIVGETGGKNFILLHPSANVVAAATATVRGGFEYQGQKCSAASRVFVPQSLWREFRDRVCADIAAIHIGDVGDFRNFMGAVIDRRAWQRLDTAIATAQASSSEKILGGGGRDCREGYFIEPTFVETSDFDSDLMTTELFGPLVTAFVYPDEKFEEVARRIDASSQYGLTGAIFSTDRDALRRADALLRYAAGNFYINDKPTGAVVGQQPFGGARASGTNDKAGSVWNLIRWCSPRCVKETSHPPTDFTYPFMSGTV